MNTAFSFQDELPKSSYEGSDQSSFEIDFDDQPYCRRHDFEPFISVCLFSTCPRRKLCWKCVDEHQLHSGPANQAPINIFKFFQMTKEALQTQEPNIQAINSESSLLHKLKDSYVNEIVTLRSEVNKQFQQIEDQVNTLFMASIEVLQQQAVADATMLSQLSKDTFLRDTNFQLMVQFYHYRDMFSDQIRTLQRRKEQFEEFMQEILIKMGSSLLAFMSISQDFDFVLKKSETKDLDDEKHKQKRKDHLVPATFSLVANLIGNENVCKSCIQLNDGNFATASRDRTIKLILTLYNRIWDSTSQACLQVLRDHNNWVQDLINLPGMAFCSCGDDKKIKIFAKDLSEMQRAMSLQQAQKKVSLLTLSLSQTRPQSVQPYEEWQCVLTLSGHNSYVMRVLHIDNRLISCSTDGTLKVWDFTQDLDEIYSIALANPVGINKEKYYTQTTLEGHDNCVYSMALAKKSDWFISGDEGGELIKWSFKDNSVICKQDTAHQGCVNCIVVQDDGTVITCGDDKTIRVWDAGLANVVKEIVIRKKQISQTLQRSEIECFIMLGPTLLLCGDETGYLLVISLTSEQVELDVAAHRDRIYRINQYGKRICTASADHTCKVWN